MAIFVLRHGQTEWNRDGRHQGWADSPLTAQGRDQARRMGMALRRAIGPAAPALVSSVSLRAADTMRLACEAAGWACDHAVMEPDLREISLGDWDGLTAEELFGLGHPTTRNGGPDDWLFHCPNGENWDQLSERLDRALARLAQDRDTALFAHSVSGKMIRGKLTGLGRDATLALDHPQDAFYRIENGRAERIAIAAP